VEFIFKRHFWIVHLLFIVTVTFFVARTLNVVVESMLAQAPVPSAAGRKAAAKPVERPAQLELERLAKLTGLPGKPDPVVTEAKETVLDMNAAPVKSGLRVKVLGTLVDLRNAEYSWASIQEVVSLKTMTYRVDDLIQGAKILEIERERVIILNNNRKEYIDGTPGDGAAPPVAVASAPARAENDAPPPALSMGTNIKQNTENDYEVPRAEVDKALNNLNDIAMQARIVPAFKDGVAQGFKLFSIRPDSLYTKIGVQNGDVIKRINGYDMNSPEKALEIYSKLKESARIDIELDRNGSSVKKTYNIR
jgi:general secretion pathway protein C